VAENDKCLSEDAINIFVKFKSKLFIPNAFSPNGDGINDVFYATGSDATFLKSFSVFNRWGKQVFAVNNVPGNDPSYGWDGTLSGGKAQVGVYYYIIELIGEDKKVIRLSGNVTLLK
jgi:gliding motility-associated-like protein